MTTDTLPCNPHLPPADALPRIDVPSDEPMHWSRFEEEHADQANAIDVGIVESHEPEIIDALVEASTLLGALTFKHGGLIKVRGDHLNGPQRMALERLSVIVGDICHKREKGMANPPKVYPTLGEVQRLVKELLPEGTAADVSRSVDRTRTGRESVRWAFYGYVPASANAFALTHYHHDPDPANGITDFLEKIQERLALHEFEREWKARRQAQVATA